MNKTPLIMLLFLHALAQAHPVSTAAINLPPTNPSATFSSAEPEATPHQAPPSLAPPPLSPIVRICENDDSYPPFRWRTIDQDGVKRSHGFGIQLISDILYRHNWRFSIDFLPIKRCLREVQTGENYHLILSSSANPERQANYRLSHPYYHVKFHAFYLKKRFPDGLKITNAEALKKYRLCGVSGHNFSMFDIPVEHFDMGAANIPSAIEKLKKGRCDIFPYNIEVVRGYKFIGWDLGQELEIQHTPLTYIQPWPVVMLISPNVPFAAELQQVINEELQQMEKSGELAQRMEKLLATDPSLQH